jgi:hypothetical protein
VVDGGKRRQVSLCAHSASLAIRIHLEDNWGKQIYNICDLFSGIFLDIEFCADSGHLRRTVAEDEHSALQWSGDEWTSSRPALVEHLAQHLQGYSFGWEARAPRSGGGAQP